MITQEQLLARVERLESHNQRLESDNQKLQAHVQKLESQVQKLEANDQKLEAHDQKLEALYQKLESHVQKLESQIQKNTSTLQKHESILQCLLTRMEDAETYMKELTTELTKEMNKSNSSVQKRFDKFKEYISEMRDEFLGETPTSRSESSAAGRHESEGIDRHCEVSDSQYNSEEFASYGRGPRRKSSKQTALAPQPPPEDSYHRERINQWVESQERLTRDDRKKKVKRPRASVNRSPDAKQPRQKRQSEQQDEDSGLPPARCHGCPKVSKRVCEVCARYVCMDHRKFTIRCPDYIPALKDCHKNGHSVARNPTRTKAGRCVSCVGGKNRKTSRTPCQNCGRFICSEHQNKHVRCLDHAKDPPTGKTATKTWAPAVDRSQPRSGFQESEVIDRIYP